MAINKKTIRLLILEDSQNEAERIVSLFRNAGHATRVHRLTSSDDLAEALQQSWDLLIAAPKSQHLDPLEALNAIRKQAKDIPFIQQVEGNDADAITEALSLGAQDALPQSEDERLVLIAKRELQNLDERRARRTAEMALREAEKRCQLLLDSSVDAIAYVHDGMHIYANRAYVQLFGYEDGEELEGMPMIDLIAGTDQSRFKDFLKSYQNGGNAADLECSGMPADGKAFHAKMSFSPATYDGEPCIQVVIRTDSDTAELEEKLREISSQDPVTGLYNRTYFIELMDTAVQQTVNQNQNATLAYLQMDRHAEILAEIGIADLDLLMANLASLINDHFAGQATLARFADDVFCALLNNQRPEQCEASLLALLKKVENQLFEIGGRTVQVTLSIGVAELDEKTSKAQEVIDRAHRCADELESNGLRRFDPAVELAQAASRGNISAMLRQALEQNSFRLLFQPLHALRGDSAEHYEVLLRLIDSQGKEVPPGEFLSVAKAEGFLEKIDRWVILNAIKLLTDHRSRGHDTRLFVHLSANSLQDAGLLPWLGVALKAARLPAEALIFQFNEADAVTYLTQAKALAQGLTQLHCRIALCQFGCALNPFNTLKHLPVEFVKVDGSYVQDLSSEENRETLKTLLTSLHEQSKQTIVPFVESASVLATLYQIKVNYIQGHYLQAPSQSMDYDFSSGE